MVKAAMQSWIKDCLINCIKVKAFDASSALTLTLAGLAAKGLTIVENGAYLGDEFEDLPAKLQSLGASLQLKDFESASKSLTKFK